MNFKHFKIPLPALRNFLAHYKFSEGEGRVGSFLILFLIPFLILSLLFLAVGVFANTTATLRPIADGGDDSADWEDSNRDACNTLNCYLEVDETSGSSCSNSDGDTSFIEGTVNGTSQTFDLDESSIPDNSTITAIDITVCHSKKGAQSNDFQTRRCIDGSCTNSGINITAGDSYTETTQSHTGLSITKISSTDIEIGVVITGSSDKEARISQISAVITYTPPGDVTAPADTTDLAASNPTTSTIDLAWTAPGDDGSSGTATTYDIRYSTSIITEGNWSSATQASGEPTPSVASSLESMTVSSLSAGTTYYFALKTSDEIPNTSGISNIASSTTEAAGDTTAPSAISNLATGTSTQTSVALTWTAPGDDNNSGTATTYDVRYSTSTITEGNWASAVQATGEPTPSIAGSSESMTVSSLSAGTTYYFALKTSDEVPNTSSLSNVVSKATESAGAVSATASVDTNWIKGGTTGQNFIFTITNSTSSSQNIQWIKITKPSTNYTINSASAGGWSTAVTASIATFTGGSIGIGTASTFTVTVNIASVDEAQTAWTVEVDDNSGGASSVTASAESSGALDTGIDSTAPTNVGIESVAVNSASKLTANATTSIDSASGHHSSPYWFDETTGGSGATDSTAWQTSTAYEDTGLSVSTEYCYRVQARDAVGNESSFSVQTCATTASTTDTTAPAAVTNLAAGSPTNSAVTLTWTAPGDDGNTGTASTYDIRYSTANITEGNWSSATQSTGEPTPSVAGSSENFTVTGLSANTTYYFALKTSDEAPNESAISNVVSKTTTDTADTTPPSISSVFVSSIGLNSVTIIWSTNEPSDSQVEYGTTLSYGSLTTLDASLVTSHVVIVTGLSGETRYNYRVKSKDSSSNLATSVNFTFSTAAQSFAGDFTPPTISEISAVPTFATATITWKTDEPATTLVEYGLTTDYESSTRKNFNLVTSHKVEIGNLKSQAKYNFRVISEDVVENEAKSGNFTFSTEKPPLSALPPPEITETTVVAVRPTSAKITWKTDLPSTSQVIFGTETGNLTQVTLEFATLITEHTITVSDLKPKTTYYFAVVSRNAAGRKGRSMEGTLETESLEIQSVIDIAKALPLSVGSPGTQIPKTAAGETVTTVPILPTEGDKKPPTVTLFNFTENPTENTSPVIRGRATDGEGVVAGISYSTDNGTSWHPITEVTGIGSSAASFFAKIPNLTDGNYEILFRVRDNSGNISKSEIKILIVDIKPPATGANVMLLGNQALLPNKFGTFSTLAGITQRIVTTAVGGAISVDIIAQKLPVEEKEVRGLIINEGLNFLNVREGPGTNYVVIGQAHPKERYEILEEGNGWYKIKFTPKDKENAETGGWVFAELVSPVSWKITKEGLVFPLIFSKSANLWFGDIKINDIGNYELRIRAIDGAGRISIRTINPIIVAGAGKVTSAKTKEAVSGAKITVLQFSPDANNFVLWPGEIFNQANPQITGDDGLYRFILPPGKYYIKMEKSGYKTFYTDIMELKSHQAINLAAFLSPRLSIKLPFSIFGINRIALPYLPNIFKERSAIPKSQFAVSIPNKIKELIGKPAPIFSLPDSKGNELDIRYLRGKKTVITTWATWSPLAQIQIPILDTLQLEEEDSVRVLLLSLQESSGVIETYLRRGNYQIPSVVDAEGEITRIYPILTIPQHFFLDRKGILRDVHIGFLNKNELKNKLKEL